MAENKVSDTVNDMVNSMVEDVNKNPILHFFWKLNV